MEKQKHPNLYFIAAFFLQFAVLGVCIALHRVFIHIGGLIGPVEQVGAEMSDPTAGRLLYLPVSAAAFLILTGFASNLSRAGKTMLPFVLAAAGGTFLWQLIGEDLWNFSVGGEHFAVIEGFSGLPFAVVFLFLLVYRMRNDSRDWGVRCASLSFAINWFGHMVFLGTYPFVSGLCSLDVWCRAVGAVMGPVLLCAGLFSGLKKAETPRQKILAAMLCYFGVAVFAFGMMGG